MQFEFFMNKILVIGSNSFSGANFIAHAARKNFEVYAVSRSKEKPHNVTLKLGQHR